MNPLDLLKLWSDMMDGDSADDNLAALVVLPGLLLLLPLFSILWAAWWAASRLQAALHPQEHDDASK